MSKFIESLGELSGEERELVLTFVRFLAGLPREQFDEGKSFVRWLLDSLLIPTWAESAGEPTDWDWDGEAEAFLHEEFARFRRDKG